MTIKFLTGRISYLGTSNFTVKATVYSSVEVETEGGPVSLSKVTVSEGSNRVMSMGKDVPIAYSEYATALARGIAVWGVLDRSAGRVFSDADARGTKALLRVGAIATTLQCALLIPFGLLFFVLPGLFFTWYLFKIWQRVGMTPSGEDIDSALLSLSEMERREVVSIPLAA